MVPRGYQGTISQKGQEAILFHEGRSRGADFADQLQARDAAQADRVEGGRFGKRPGRVGGESGPHQGYEQGRINRILDRGRVLNEAGLG